MQTPRFVGGCGFELSSPSLPSPVTRGPRALRHVLNQPTAHRALSLHAADLARLSARPTHGVLHRVPLDEAPGTDTALCWRLRLRTVVTVSC